MTSAIIFDMDGTLFQTNLILEPALEATFDVLREKGLWVGATPIETYREIMGVSLPVVWKTLCPEHSQEQQKKSNTLFQKKLIQQIKAKNGALYPGVEDTLANMAKHYSLYIASNGQQEYLNAISEVYQLDRYIQKIYSIDLIPSGDKSELVSFVQRENNIVKGYVVGDRASDIQAAKDNKFVSIGVRFDFSQEDELALADYTVEAFHEIGPIISR